MGPRIGRAGNIISSCGESWSSNATRSVSSGPFQESQKKTFSRLYVMKRFCAYLKDLRDEGYLYGCNAAIRCNFSFTCRWAIFDHWWTFDHKNFEAPVRLCWYGKKYCWSLGAPAQSWNWKLNIWGPFRVFSIYPRNYRLRYDRCAANRNQHLM